MEGLEGKYADLGLPGITLIVLIASVVCVATYFFLRKRIEKKIILAVLSLFSIGFSFALFTILQNHFISGADAPYYVYQVKNILEHGSTTEFAPPLVFYTMAGFSVFVNDVTLGVKIAQAFFPVLMGLTTFLLVEYLTKNNFASLGVALLVTFFVAGIAGTIGAIKNMAAMALTPLFYLFFLKLVNGEGRKWTIKTLKIGERKFGLTLSTSLLISVALFFVLIATHFLTAGFVFISVAAYVAFYMGYRRKIPWQEFKFFGLLGVLISFALISSTLRQHIIHNANTFAESYPIPGDLFPFLTHATVVVLFIPLIALTLPAARFILRQRDRRAQLLIAALLTALLCSQPWIITQDFSFRFLFMIFLSAPALLGISIWMFRKSRPKVSSGILVAGIVFGSVMPVGMITGLVQIAPPGAISEEQWNALAGLREQLPENCVIGSTSPELIPDDFHWQQLLLGPDVAYFQAPWEPPLPIENLAERLANSQQEQNTAHLAIVPLELIENRGNFAEFGLKDTGIGNAYCRVLELEDSLASLIELGHQLPDDHVIFSLLPESMRGEWIHASLGYYRNIHFVETTPTENLAEKLSRHENEMHQPCLAIVFVEYYENRNLDELGLELLTNNETYGALKAKGIGLYTNLSEFSEAPSIENQEWHEEESPQPTNEIRFSPNPLVAFILLPIELVQGLYGTWIYGPMKLLVAVPLSIGIIGFLIGLFPAFVRKCKWVWKKISR